MSAKDRLRELPCRDPNHGPRGNENPQWKLYDSARARRSDVSLQHDVGTGDGIVKAMQEHYGRNMYQISWKNLSMDSFASTQNKMRTAPLWGLRLRPQLIHDGLSLTFRDAILRHRGEATDVTKRFEKLKKGDQEASSNS